MKFDIIGGSYEHKYKDYNAEKTINWYPVIKDIAKLAISGYPIKSNIEKPKNDTALFPFPGASSFASLSGTYNRGIGVARTINYYRCFTVVDKTLFEINAGGTVKNYGSLSNLALGTTKVYFTADSSNKVGIFHNSASYYFDMTNNTSTQITGGGFPGSVDYADYLNGVTFIVSNGVVYYSNVNDLTTWNALNFFGASQVTAPVMAVGCHKDRIFLFTSASVEPFQNDGTTPYSKIAQSSSLIGLAVKDTLAKFNNGFVFVGRDQERGELGVYWLSESYTINQISDTSITWMLNELGISLNSATGFILHSKDGHLFYHLSIPELNTTYIYDFMTNAWCERQSTNPNPNSDGNIVQGMFRGKYFTSFYGLNLFTDIYSPNIFKEDWTVFTEMGSTIYRTRISNTLNQDDKLIDISELIVDVNTGYPGYDVSDDMPMMQVSISRDGGYKFCNPRNMKMGLVGKHKFRARLTCLGQARNWIFKLVCSDAVDVMIQSAEIHGSVGNW